MCVTMAEVLFGSEQDKLTSPPSGGCSSDSVAARRILLDVPSSWFIIQNVKWVANGLFDRHEK